MKCSKIAVAPTPKQIYEAIGNRIEAAAATDRHSLNGKAISCLEAMLLPSRIDPAKRPG